MKQKRLFLFAGSALLLASLIVPEAAKQNKKLDPDEIVYKEEKPVDLRHPFYASGEDEEEEESVTADKVILHYVNEDNACKTRAFYVWVNGVDGVEYSDANASDIVTYSDGSMSIVIDIKNDPRFQAFAGSSKLMYIIKYKKISESNLNWGGQSDDVELKFTQFSPVNGEVEVWCTPAAGGGIAQFATEAETKVDGIKLAEFTDWKTIRCVATDNCQSVNYTLYAFDETYYKIKPKEREAIKRNYIVKEGQVATASSKVFEIKFTYNAHINVVYSLVSKESSSTSELTKTAFVSFTNLYTDERFETYYTHKTSVQENDLGMNYDAVNKKCTIKVWAPTAANMSLLMYSNGTPVTYQDDTHPGSDKYKAYHMTYRPGGVWSITFDWNEDETNNPIGKYYAIQVDNSLGTTTTMDPYATACGINGVRAYIYDKNVTNPDGWENFEVKDISTPQELTVYEVHVQDFTGDSSWNGSEKNGTYNAFVEKGTRVEGHSDLTTGYDHLNELGIDAVQLMPVFDHDNDESKEKYNWGYNPLNYNCVEGAYSSDPHDPLARIKEFKNLILQMSKTDAKTRVIMDVVYNHVSSASGSCFNKIMPRYFFRYDENGELYDGSGCHNEFRSEGTMGRKYICDSIYMWAREYNIKGFRFDLMALLDTKTLAAVKKTAYLVDPDIYVYGEGWTAGGFHGGYDYENNCQSVGTFCCNGNGDQVYSEQDLYTEDNACVLGGFNDAGRNAVRGGNDQGWGSPNHLPGWGFMQKGRDDANYDTMASVGEMVWGVHNGIGGNPKQTVNYASCHDNWTLRDQLYYTLGNGTKAGNAYDILHAEVTTHTLIFASNACAFMLGGEELLRTKDTAFATAEEKEKILPNTYETMYGHDLSHNSYNSPLSVNTFKWNNKVSVSIDDTTVDMTIESNNLTKVFANLVKLHHEMPKLDYTQACAAREGDTVYWAGKQWGGSEDVDYYSSMGIKFGPSNNQYFIFVAGRQMAYFRDSDQGIYNGMTLLTAYSNGTYNYNSATYCLDVGDSSYNVGFASLVYKKK